MGAALQTLGLAEVASEIACCAGSAACGLLCKKKGSAQGARSKLIFILFMGLANILSFIMLVPDMRKYLDKVPYLCNTISTPQMCDSLVGYSAAYRVFFVMAIFYFIFSILTYDVTSTKQFRARLHNGFWYIKLSFLTLIFIAVFCIPNITKFGMIWMYVGLIGGFMFLLLQVVLIIDFGYSWSVNWAEKIDVVNAKCWFFALAFATAIVYALSLCAAAVLYINFTNPVDISQCKANTFYISFNVAHCALATIISILPQIQQEASGAGLLQSSVVTIYTMYLTWNTLSSQPDSLCNPLGDVILEYDKASGVNGQAVFGSVLTFALLTFACTVRANTSQLGKLGLALSDNPDYLRKSRRVNRKKNRKDKPLKKKHEDEEDVEDSEDIAYSYSIFHFVLFLASLHLMMVITNWHSPDETEDFKKLIKNWSAVWVQMSASFICCLVFIWTLVAPLIKRTWGDFLGLEPEPTRRPSARRPSVNQLKSELKDIQQRRKSTSEQLLTRQADSSSELKRRNSTSKNAASESDLATRAVSESPSVLTRKELAHSEITVHRGFGDDHPLRDINESTFGPENTRADDVHIDMPMGRSSPILEEPNEIRMASAASGRRSDPLRPFAIQIEHPFVRAAHNLDLQHPKNTEANQQILRLQERILRFQAKIVKIQHKLLYLQQTGERLESPVRELDAKKG